MKRLHKSSARFRAPGTSSLLAARYCALLSILLLTLCSSLRAQQTTYVPPELTSGAVLLDAASSPPASDSPDQADTGTNTSSKTQPITPEQLTFADRLKLYEHSYTNPESLIGPVLSAVASQTRDVPPEWGGSWPGFGKRFASAYGRYAISQTVILWVAAADHEDPRYHPSDQAGIWPRARHVIVSTFVSRTTGGGSMPAISRFAGVYGAAFLASSWEPPSQRGPGHAIERGSTAMLSSVGWHLFEEFWPDIKNALHHRHE